MLSLFDGLNDINLGVFAYEPTTGALLFASQKFLKDHGLESEQNPNITDFVNLDTDSNDVVSNPNTKKHYKKHRTNCVLPNGRTFTLCVDADITDIMSNEKLHHDFKWESSLTGLANRAKLVYDLTKIFEENKKGHLLMIVNVDFFSRVNFSYGYEYGNAFIREVAKFLSFFGDIADVYSLEGAEYALIMSDEANFERFVFDLKERFKQPWEVQMLEQFCTASTGVVRIDKTSSSADILIQKATVATKRAKSMGSNKVHFFEPSVYDKITLNTQLEYHLRRSVMKKIESFKVYYQPIINTQTGTVSGLEALVRWVDDDIGFVLPGDFIGLAEYLGFIGIIDRHVLKTASAFVRQLHEKGHYIRINVNVSGKQLHDDDFVENIQRIVHESGLEPSYVMIEITETSIGQNTKEIVNKIEQLKRIGMSVALDDFGTGYSSLNILKELPIFTVKIDRKFVKDMQKSKYDHTFIKTIIELAHSANLKVCCEGVETLSDLSNLEVLKSDEVQGFYFSRPLPEENVLTELEKRNKPVL